jgi:hypothetical protein
MSILSISDWCRWGLQGLDTYVDTYLEQVNGTLHPPTPAATLSQVREKDVYEAPAPALRDTARIEELKARKRAVDAERQTHQRAYRTAELLFCTSALVAGIGVALLSSPFTIPLGLMMFGGGALGALTFYPRRGESKENADKLKDDATILLGQILEAER